MDTFGLHLHQCTFNENVNVLKNLIETGNDLNQRDEHGETATHIAAKFDKVNALKLLLDGGANIKAVNKEKRNILHIAIENNSFKCIHSLLELVSVSEIINRIDCNGLSPLMIAIEKKEKIDISLKHDQQKIIELLVEHRFMGNVFQEIHSTNMLKYETHFQCAIECENDFAIECMIKKAQESSLESIINCPSFVHYIIRQPNKVNLRNNKNQTPLQQAIICKNFNIAELLLKNHADCSYRDAKLCSPLHFAVDHYNRCCTHNNTRACADVEKLDNCCELRETYLVNSKLFDNKCVHLAIILYLVNECNADVFAENSFGEIILDYFIDEPQIFEYIISAVIERIRINCYSIATSRYLKYTFNVFAARMKRFENANKFEIYSCDTKFKNQKIVLQIFLSEAGNMENVVNSCVDQKTFNNYFSSLRVKYEELFNHEKGNKEVSVEQRRNELIFKSYFWNSFELEVNVERCEQYGNEMIHDACLNNDVRLLCNALKIMKPYEISETNDNGENALHIAVKHASLECLELLVVENVKFPNICDNQRKTQIDYALSLCLRSSPLIRNRRAQVVVCLLQILNTETPLNSIATVKRNLLPDLVDDLPVNQSASLRLLSIYYAAYHGQSEIIEAILDKFPNLVLEDKIVSLWIAASLKSAAAKKYLHIVELLITKIASYGHVGMQLVDSCVDELLCWNSSICCLDQKKCSRVFILQKCSTLRNIYMRTSFILPSPLSKCCVPALIVFLIEVGCTAVGQKLYEMIKMKKCEYMFLLYYKLHRYYNFVSKNKQNEIVFNHVLDEKHAFELWNEPTSFWNEMKWTAHCSQKQNAEVESILKAKVISKREKKKKCCVQ